MANESQIKGKKQTKGEKDKTSVLSPISAVEMVWALTATASEEDYSTDVAGHIDEKLKQILESHGDHFQEKEYLTGAEAAIAAARRSLEIIYKGRKLNFDENKELRKESLKAFKETLTFGKNAKNVLESFPTMVVSTAIGDFTLVGLLDKVLSKFIPSEYSTFIIVVVTLLFAACGYFIHRLAVIVSRKKKEGHLITQDIERNNYYEQYLDRSADILSSLYERLEAIHKKVFGQKYYPDEDADALVEKVIAGVRPTWCEYVGKHHMENKKITPKLWSVCETGSKEVIEHCKHWKKEKEEEAKIA